MDSYELIRRAMVDIQLKARGIADARVLDAFRRVPRELFVPDAGKPMAYEDHPVPIGHGQTISQPYVVALSVESLDVREHHRVLDVGAGSGYQAAILAQLARQVFALERIAELTEQARQSLQAAGATNVTLGTGDGSLGWPEHAPFDRIICGAAAPDIPPAWVDQLADGGRIVLPMGGIETQMLMVLEKHNGVLSKMDLCPVRFVKLIGEQAWRE